MNKIEIAKELQGWLLQKVSRTDDCTTSDGTQIVTAIGPCIPQSQSSSYRYTYKSTTTDALNRVTIQLQLDSFYSSSTCTQTSVPVTVNLDFATSCSPINLVSYATNKTYTGTTYSYIPGVITPLPTSGGWGFQRNYYVDHECQGIPYKSEFFAGAYSACEEASSTLNVKRQCDKSVKVWNYYSNQQCTGTPLWSSKEPSSCLSVVPSLTNPIIVSYFTDSCYEGIPVASTSSLLDKANPLNLPPGIIATLAFIPFLVLLLSICYFLRQRCCPKPVSVNSDASTPDFNKEGNSGFTSETTTPL